jgi:hypothetical protein
MWKEGALNEESIVMFFMGVLCGYHSLCILCSFEYKYIRKLRICISI